ncbi:MAG TPA: SusC/RagA family TonB-linked outer membrane protein [Sphingobacteriaceae bacterium]
MYKYRYTIFSCLLITALQVSSFVSYSQRNDGKDTLNNQQSNETIDATLNLPLGFTTTQKQTVGAINKIGGEDLRSYPDLSFSNTLQGRLMGLTVRQSTSGLGNNDASLYIRGLARGSNDQALTIVDGIERPIDFLNPEEIESVTILKDANSKILYGPRAANGVVLITTKRGKLNSKVLKVSADYGTSMATRLPEYLNSYQYANLYNEARANDGLTPFYSAAALSGYQQSTGALDQRYPNVDYYDYFLDKNTPYRKANLEYSGGQETSKYAFILGYNGSDGFEKVGKTPTQDRVNLRGNLDFQVGPMLKAFVDANAIVETRSWSGIDQNSVFSALSTHRPNEYPIIITDPTLAAMNTKIGDEPVPPLGGSYLRPTNLYGNLLYGGSTKSSFFYGQTTFGLDLNLGRVVKGLSVKSTFTFDNYQFFQQGKDATPVTYASELTKTSLGADTIVYFPLQQRVNPTTLVRQSESIARNMGFIAAINYVSKVGNNELNANLSHFYFKNEDRTSIQDIKNTNTLLKLNYNISNKIFTEGTLALMGSNRFASSGDYFKNGINANDGMQSIDGNRFNLSSALGLAWVISEENFLKDSRILNYLKLKSSYGVLGYDASTDFYLFNTRYYDNGTYSFNQPNVNNAASNAFRASLDRVGNPNLEWEKSRELNIGAEGLALNNLLGFEFNYFNTLRYDMIVTPNNQYPDVAGGLFGPVNMGRTKNQGVEGRANWGTRLGDVKLDLGGNFIYSKNKVVETNEVLNQPANLLRTGTSSDAIFGYNATGLFRDPAALSVSPFQTYGKYGVGDIAYQDLNKDNVIDNRDALAIGNSFPRTTLGLDMNFRYKRLGLFLLATSELGVNAMATNSYFRNSGEGKYSALALNRYHPVNNPAGTQPALTTYSGANNNLASTFWMVDADFLRLKNAELSYTIDRNASTVKAYRFYLRGTNLLVFSSMKDLDPEVLNAGVTNYPVYRTVTAGVSVDF